MHCRACGHEVERSGGRRIGFAETCDACRADLHSCANCAHHDPSAYNECRESSAERVADRERSNRCEYFRPGEHAGGDGAGERNRALAELDALFKKA